MQEPTQLYLGEGRRRWNGTSDVRYGFEFLGYQIKRGQNNFIFPADSWLHPRVRYMHIPRRSRSGVSWTRSGNEPSKVPLQPRH
jgi:hypothetical protein